MTDRLIVTSHLVYIELSQLGLDDYFKIEYVPEFRNPYNVEEFNFPRDLFLLLPNNTIYIPSPLKEKKKELSSFFNDYLSHFGGRRDSVYGRALNPKVLECVRDYFSKGDISVLEGKSSVEGGNIQFGTSGTGNQKAVIGLSSLLISCHNLFLELPYEERVKKVYLEKTKRTISKEIKLDVDDLIFLPQREYHIDLEMIVSNGVVYYHDDHLALKILKSLEKTYGKREEFQKIKASAQMRAKNQEPLKTYCKEIIKNAGFLFKEIPGFYSLSLNEKFPRIFVNFMNGFSYGDDQNQFFLTNGCHPSCPLLKTDLLRELQTAFDESFEKEVIHLSWESTQWLHRRKSGIRCAINILPPAVSISTGLSD